MSGCKHKNATVVENGSTTIGWQLQDGKAIFSWQNPGAISPIIHILCDECGLDKSYNRYKGPKWVRELSAYINFQAGYDEDEYEKAQEKKRLERYKVV